jgi:Dihydroorotate dehydrogenase
VLLNASGCLDALTAPGLARSLDALVTKTVTPLPRSGNAPVRIAETEHGMLNAIGLANPGLTDFVAGVLPRLAELGVPIWVSVGGFSARDYSMPIRGGGVVSDDLSVGPEDLEEVGLDPDLLERPLGRKDFLFNTGKLLAAAVAAGPFFLAEEQARAAEVASLGRDPIATIAINAAKNKFHGARVAPDALANAPRSEQEFAEFRAGLEAEDEEEDSAGPGLASPLRPCSDPDAAVVRQSARGGDGRALGDCVSRPARRRLLPARARGAARARPQAAALAPDLPKPANLARARQPGHVS